MMEQVLWRSPNFNGARSDGHYARDQTLRRSPNVSGACTLVWSVRAVCKRACMLIKPRVVELARSDGHYSLLEQVLWRSPSFNGACTIRWSLFSLEQVLRRSPNFSRACTIIWSVSAVCNRTCMFNKPCLWIMHVQMAIIPCVASVVAFAQCQWGLHDQMVIILRTSLSPPFAVEFARSDGQSPPKQDAMFGPLDTRYPATFLVSRRSCPKMAVSCPSEKRIMFGGVYAQSLGPNLPCPSACALLYI